MASVSVRCPSWVGFVGMSVGWGVCEWERVVQREKGGNGGVMDILVESLIGISPA